MAEKHDAEKMAKVFANTKAADVIIIATVP